MDETPTAQGDARTAPSADTPAPETVPGDVPEHVIVGGGIAGLAAAVCLLREARVPGSRIRILEATDRPGGSLDGSGDPESGYLVRGGRMFERHFACTFDLLSAIPAPGSAGWSLGDEIRAFNLAVPGSARCRILRGGACVAAPRLGLGLRGARALAGLIRRTEESLDGVTIEEALPADVLETDFWLLWSTTFAFRRWHSAAEMRRYMRRFVHLLPGFARLEGILRTPWNQTDSLVRPVAEWLAARGVRIETGAEVRDLEFAGPPGARSPAALIVRRDGAEERLLLAPGDRVLLTLGSMTAGSTTGARDAAPPAPAAPGESPAWRLWRRIAEAEPGFGRPDAFLRDAAATAWVSATLTLRGRAFLDRLEAMTGNRTGTGGLVTLAASPWTLSLVAFHQPHFRDQPADVAVAWAYGLTGERAGSVSGKAMADCTGAEILAEIAHHAGLGAEAEALFEGAAAIPCLMPHITAQFMPRRPGDRPQIVPPGTRNIAVMGQFCEQPDDCVFTVEYSVRSAWAAVHALTGLGRPPPPVVRTDRDPGALWAAARTILRG